MNWEIYEEAEAFILPLLGIAFIVIAMARCLILAMNRYLRRRES